MWIQKFYNFQLLHRILMYVNVPTILDVCCTPCSEKKWYILFLNETSQLQAQFSYNFQ